MTREVTLELTSGEVLPPFTVDVPWWQESGSVVEGARAHLGRDVIVLRILSTEPGLTSGGRVTYLAEPPGPGAVELGDAHPLRAAYARPGGPARSLAWAGEHVLVTGAAQQRTWNLSAIWRIDTASGPVWLKHVPPFFSHEAAVLRYLAKAHPAGRWPDLIAADASGRMLLADIPGDDLYRADIATRRAIVTDIVRMQISAAVNAETLAEAGVPDRRGAAMTEWLSALADEPWIALRVSAAAGCGLPDTLVHGDLHPGNVRGSAAERTIIDWGDAFLGSPVFDVLRISETLSADEAGDLVAHWARLWRAAVPGCDPERAVRLLAPVAALRNAAVYAGFLANIEPSEHRYHDKDVPFWMAEARARLAEQAEHLAERAEGTG